MRHWRPPEFSVELAKDEPGAVSLVVTSTAAYPDMCAADGLVGALDVVLWPIQNGMLAYAGCKVLAQKNIQR